LSDRRTWEPADVVTQVDDGVWLIDLGFQGRRGVVAAYLLAGGNDLALIETGPSSTLPALLSGIRAAGFEPEQLTHVLVTHIHLDHSGALGPLLRSAPEARVTVHPFGAPHLVDPSKLANSAARIYGDKMETLWGEIAGVPAEQVFPATDDEIIHVADRDLQILFTPGHANHHLAFVDSAAGAIFSGDVGGITMPGTKYVCAPTPPPELNPVAWKTSIERMRDTHARRLYLTHFGVVNDAQRHLAELGPDLDAFLAIGKASFDAGEDGDTLTARLHEHMAAGLAGFSDETLVNLEWATPSYMATLGLQRYWRKQAERQSA
jgi:glyoxylase-like metal-dependent hydrolase (beta-lactamase superfamily II)